MTTLHLTALWLALFAFGAAWFAFCLCLVAKRADEDVARMMGEGR